MSDDTKKCPFCAETIKAEAKKCSYCGEFLPGQTREAVWRELITGNIEAGALDDVEGAAIGHKAQAASTGDVAGPVILSQGDVTLGKALPDEQYRLALNWDGKTNLRGFDLAERNLSDAQLPKADSRGAKLIKSDLRQANLSAIKLRASCCFTWQALTNGMAMKTRAKQDALFDASLAQLADKRAAISERVADKMSDKMLTAVLENTGESSQSSRPTQPASQTIYSMSQDGEPAPELVSRK